MCLLVTIKLILTLSISAKFCADQENTMYTFSNNLVALCKVNTRYDVGNKRQVL